MHSVVPPNFTPFRKLARTQNPDNGGSPTPPTQSNAVQRDSSRASFGLESLPGAYTNRSLSARSGLAYYPVIALCCFFTTLICVSDFHLNSIPPVCQFFFSVIY